MKKYPDIESYLDDLDPWMQKQFSQTRRLLLSFSPITEKMRYGLPFYDYKGMLLYMVRLQKIKLVLGFCNGNMMSDEAGVLRADEGQTQVKHWIFEKDKKIDESLLSQYIHEAILINDFIADQKKKKKK
jgi:hypothetical protein